MAVRLPTAAELAARFGSGLLAVVGPEPVMGPWIIGPLVNEAERPKQPPLIDGFSWEYWAGPDLRSVRIDLMPDPRGVDPGYFQAMLKSYGHEGTAAPETLPVVVDGVRSSFHGERVGEGVIVLAVVAGVEIEIRFMDGWPLDEALSLEHREGEALDALLVLENRRPPSNMRWKGGGPRTPKG
jgi:hypothetical protein